MKTIIALLIVTNTMYPGQKSDVLSITPFVGPDALTQCEIAKDLLLNDTVQGAFNPYKPFADYGHSIRCRTNQ